MHRRKLHMGKFTNEFRSRRKGVSVPIPSGHIQRMDSDNEWCHWFKRGLCSNEHSNRCVQCRPKTSNYHSRICIFFFVSSFRRSTNNRFVKQIFTCIYTSCFSLYLVHSSRWICLLGSSLTISTSKRKKRAVHWKCSWPKIKRNIIMQWRKWVRRNHWKRYQGLG